MKTRLLPVIVIGAMIIVLVLGAAAAVAAPILGHPAMVQVWDRTDRPVVEGRVARTWMWGPSTINVLREPYKEALGGERIVAYLDKSRMEVTYPNRDQSSPWFVTNGLLAEEMITGRLQLGDAAFEQRSPAQIPVAGDPDDQNAPTYATFTNLLGRVNERRAAVMETIDKSGRTGQNGALGNYTDYVYYVPETGHNIPDVFWDFLNSQGLVYENGAFRTANLFQPTFFATGFPITEAYWVDAKVAGKVQPVLVQAYERRVLTYTPGNPQGWQVEMGNAGRHYHNWRYPGAP